MDTGTGSPLVNLAMRLCLSQEVLELHPVLTGHRR
jgi:hypothetical protein